MKRITLENYIEDYQRAISQYIDNISSISSKELNKNYQEVLAGLVSTPTDYNLKLLKDEIALEINKRKKFNLTKTKN